MTDPRTSLPGAPPSLVDRVKNILMTPKTEWPRIDPEPATVQGLYTGYVMILAAIPPLASLIGQQLIGVSVLGVTYKPAISYSVGFAAITYVMSLITVYVLGLIIDALAPSFGGTKDSLKAFKVAVYSSTAFWVAGIFGVVPMLGFLALLGLYGLYLLYLGLPVLMRVPQDKALGYVVVVIVVDIVLYFVVAMIVGALVASFFGVAAMTGGAVPTIRY